MKKHLWRRMDRAVARFEQLRWSAFVLGVEVAIAIFCFNQVGTLAKIAGVVVSVCALPVTFITWQAMGKLEKLN